MQRIEGADAAFLAAETGEWPFHVSVVQILDPSGVSDFGFESIRALFARRVHLIPQLRWKVVPPPLGIGWSYLADDPQFDLDLHLHRIAVPAPGDREQLGRLVGDLISHPIDRRLPLWEAWFIEGLSDGAVALLIKVHHSIIDGQSGVDVAAALYDMSPETADTGEPPEYSAQPLPSWREVSARNGVRALSLPWDAARLGRQMIEQAAVAAPRAFGARRPVMPFQAPRTPFNGQLSPHRTFAAAALPLDRLREVRAATGVKLNDVVLAVCAGALRHHLIAQGALPERPLIAQVPVSTRTDATRSQVGSQVASMFVSLATDVVDPAARLRAVHDSAGAGKDLRGQLAEHRHLGLGDALPPALFSLAARAWTMAHLDARTPPIYNVIISNVAGPPFDFYVAGARNVALHPMGPLLFGGGLNITVLSHGSTLDVGLVSCRELVPDLWPLADAFEPALEELAAAVGLRRRGKR